MTNDSPLAPLIVILVNNNMLATIRMHQERRFPGRVVGTALKNPDFLALARAHPCQGLIQQQQRGRSRCKLAT